MNWNLSWNYTHVFLVIFLIIFLQTHKQKTNINIRNKQQQKMKAFIELIVLNFILTMNANIYCYEELNEIRSKTSWSVFFNFE